jgi:Phage protein (N4 Gp49/phage Sf6 gene 66) family
MSPFNPTHVSHKRVEAYPIAAAEFASDGSGKVGVNHPEDGYLVIPVPPGFLRRPGAVTEGDMLVRYEPTAEEPHGYLSHSPRAVFEAGYAPISRQAEPASGAKRLSMADIQSVIVSESYHRVQGSTFMVCFLTLRNGFIVTGESACADPDAYDRATGEKFARENAVEKIWTLEGYLLRERLHEAALGDRAHDDLGRVA